MNKDFVVLFMCVLTKSFYSIVMSNDLTLLVPSQRQEVTKIAESLSLLVWSEGPVAVNQTASKKAKYE